MKNLASTLFAAILFAVLSVSAQATGELDDQAIAELSRTTIFGSPDLAASAAEKLAARGNADVVPALILALRYRGDSPALTEAIAKLTGETIRGWNQAMLWQEAHPEIPTHPSFRDLKVEIFQRIDPNFLRFLGGSRSDASNLDIRLEEITWGGVSVDGIPSLDDPKLISAEQADYLVDTDLVFGVEINGDVRAYPLRIMGWHEMFNETIGGVPVALAYCTLCGSGILFETHVPGQEKPLIFGSSGFLYRSNKLMFDRQTDSLWNQFTGEPVSGPMRETGIKLKIRPVAITSWSKWKEQHPNTKVLSLETGHSRDYGSGVVYSEYFASPELMFPTIVRDESRLSRKDYVFGIRDVGTAKAWPLDVFEGGAVINDAIGGRNIVLIGDAGTRTVRAYEREGREFSRSADGITIAGPGGDWRVTEQALTGPDGKTLARVPGHIAYWFAWDGYMGLNADLYDRQGTR